MRQSPTRSRRRDAPTRRADARERTPTRRGESIAFAIAIAFAFAREST
jgi:hypothetical protein